MGFGRETVLEQEWSLLWLPLLGHFRDAGQIEIQVARPGA